MTVTEVEDDNGAGLDFLGGLNPQAEPQDIRPVDDDSTTSSPHPHGNEAVLMDDHWDNKTDKEKGRTEFLKSLCERVAEMMKAETMDEETIRMVERLPVLRVSTKHVNLWSRQLEMKMK